MKKFKIFEPTHGFIQQEEWYVYKEHWKNKVRIKLANKKCLEASKQKLLVNFFEKNQLIYQIKMYFYFF